MKSIWIFALLAFALQIRASSGGRTAVCFLTVRPARETLRFADDLARGTRRDSIDVFVMIDDNNFDISSAPSSVVTLLQIPNQQCVTHGYQQTMYIQSRPINISSWDKTLLYFARLNQNYSFVWFIEEDVFISSVEAFLAVHRLYSRTSDLIVKRVQANLSGDMMKWHHWHLAYDKLPPPWFESMTNGVGLSRRLLQSFDDFIRWRGVSTFHEYVLQTLSMRSNLTVVCPTEFDTFEWLKKHPFKDIQLRPNNWWHPVKNLTDHTVWRQRILEQNTTAEDEIRWTHWRSLCNKHSNSAVRQEHLRKLVVAFDQIKIRLSPDRRRWIRDRFLCLAQQCRAQQDLKSAEMIIDKLADNAYKLPEPSWPGMPEKTLSHLIMEKELVHNRQYVLHFSKYPAVVNLFRQLAANLTMMLTNEIQRQTKGRDLQPSIDKFSVLNVSLEQCPSVSTATSVVIKAPTSSRVKMYVYTNLQAIYFVSVGTLACVFVLVRLFRPRSRNSILDSDI